MKFVAVVTRKASSRQKHFSRICCGGRTGKAALYGRQFPRDLFAERWQGEQSSSSKLQTNRRRGT